MLDDAQKGSFPNASRAEGPVSRNTLEGIFLSSTNRQPSDSTRDAFVRLMAKLDNDFYVKSAGSSYTFFSRVLQLWWKTHYGYQGE